MDASIGRLLDRLIELDLFDNTYLIFFSDNGGRNTIPQAPPNKEHRNAPLRDGKHSFYEGGIRVPFIVIGPGVKAGSVCTVPVTGLDVFPTIADLAGFPEPLPENIDGGSLRLILHNSGMGSVQRAHPFLIFHQAADRTAISAIRQGDYKLVKTWGKDQLELFDLSQDLSETDDLSDRMRDKTRELDALLTGFLEEVRAETRGADK
jgi:arylsulfatase A-like enzyme